MSSAAVIITSKDRAKPLMRAIRSVLRQTADVELLVVDDGSTDETAKALQTTFPTVRVIRNETSLGIIAARNQAMAHVRAEYVFTLDDDAEFGSAEAIETSLRQFDHPRIGAVCIPLVNHFQGKTQRCDFYPSSDDANFLCTATFRGGANVIRRTLFLELGGYSGIGRQGEEIAFCTKMLDAGYVVRCGSGCHIDHYPGGSDTFTPEKRRWQATNNAIFAWQFVPTFDLPFRMLGICTNQIHLGVKHGCLSDCVGGIFDGLSHCLKNRRIRQPVRRRTYKLSRMLRRRGCMSFDAVEPQLCKAQLPLTQSETTLPEHQFHLTSERDG